MIVLDTHAWFWWITKCPSFRQTWRDAIAEERELAISAISLMEIAWLAQNRRIDVGADTRFWFECATTGSRVSVLPITPESAVLAASLPMHHRDPYDRMIIATALTNGARLMSADGKFELYEELKGVLVA